jgi:hypothetical protein
MNLSDPFAERPRLEECVIRGTPVRCGSRVRLWPRGRADIIDLVLDTKTAVVEAIEEDLEGRLFLAVTVEDDPGRDLGAVGKIAHRFFFRPDEIQPLSGEPSGVSRRVEEPTCNDPAS